MRFVSQWSLTFEVRKRQQEPRLLRWWREYVAMEPDL